MLELAAPLTLELAAPLTLELAAPPMIELAARQQVPRPCLPTARVEWSRLFAQQLHQQLECQLF